MSNTESEPAEIRVGGPVTLADGPVVETLPGRIVPLGRYTTVNRVLPHRQRRTIGAWCFLDHFGPVEPSDRPGMQVPPHPHTGLQTVTWLAAGEIVHTDSLGSVQTVRPGELGLMSAGRGIAHAEVSASGRPATLHGLQMWVALPDPVRHGPPAFAHHPVLPVLSEGGMNVTVVAGELAGARSPALVHTELVGAEVTLSAGSGGELPLDPAFEYAVVVMSGSVELPGGPLDPGGLRYLGTGRTELGLRAGPDTRLFLIGGTPFEESLVMWWNFVGRTHEEIVEAREAWAASSDRFGVVRNYPGDRLPAPPMPAVRLTARDRAGRGRP